MSSGARGCDEAALLHDVGKLAVPEAVLRKHGAFTPEEYEQMKTHAAARRADRRGPARRRADLLGTCSPRAPGRPGLPGRPRRRGRFRTGARIIAVADAYDAITRGRINRELSSAADAIAELRRGADSQFDAAAVNAIADWVTDSGQLQPERPGRTPNQADADTAEGPPS